MICVHIGALTYQTLFFRLHRYGVGGYTQRNNKRKPSYTQNKIYIQLSYSSSLRVALQYEWEDAGRRLKRNRGHVEYCHLTMSLQVPTVRVCGLVGVCCRVPVQHTSKQHSHWLEGLLRGHFYTGIAVKKKRKKISYHIRAHFRITNTGQGRQMLKTRLI